MLGVIGTFAAGARLPSVSDPVTNPYWLIGQTDRYLFTVQQPVGADGLFTSEIWQTDGRSGAGRWQGMSAELQAQLAPANLVRFGTKLAFTVNTFETREVYSTPFQPPTIQTLHAGRELRIMDAATSPATTFDVNPEPGYGSWPTGLVAINNRLFFAGDGGFPTGRELWSTDGGTPTLVRDVYPIFYDTPAPLPWYEQAAIDALWGVVKFLEAFFAMRGAIPLFNPFETVLSTVGWVVMKLVYPVLHATGVLASFTDWLAGQVEEALGGEIVVPPLPEALEALTRYLINDINDDWYGNGLTFPDQLTQLGGGMLFRGTSPTQGLGFWPNDPSLVSELWWSNASGSDARPIRLGDAFPEASPQFSNPFLTYTWQRMLLDPSNIMPLGDGRAVFAATREGVRNLYVTDSTDANTFRIASGILPLRDIGEPDFAVVGGRAVFAASGTDGTGTELWASDGTRGGVWRLADIVAGSGSSDPANFQLVRGGAIFEAGAAGGRRIWFTDGTAEGTRQVPGAPVGINLGSRLEVSGDTTAPDTAIATLPSHLSAAGITLSGTVGAWDVDKVQLLLTAPGETDIRVDAAVLKGVWWSHTLPSLAEARWTVTATAVDLAGNADATAATASFTLDRTPPTVAFTSVPAATRGEGVIVTGTAAADATSVRLTITPSLFGGEALRVVLDAPVTAGSWTVTLPELQQLPGGVFTGQLGYNLRVVAQDAAGNTTPTAALARLTVDETAPVTTALVLGEINKASRGELPVHWIGADLPSAQFNAGGMGGVLHLDGPLGRQSYDIAQFATRSDLSRPVEGRGFEWSGRLALPEDGTYTLTAILRDLAGNEAAPIVRSFTVTRPADWRELFFDDTPPETALTTAPPALGNAQSFVFAGTTSGGAARVTLTITDALDNPLSTHAALVDSYGNWSVEAPLPGPDGLYRAAVVATDRAGNTDATPATASWRIDRTAPDTALVIEPTTGLIRGLDLSIPDLAGIRLTLTNPFGQVSTAIVTGSAGGFWQHQIAQPVSGNWQLRAAAFDQAGNFDPTPAEAVVTVDLDPPETGIALPELTAGGLRLRGSSEGGATAIEYRLTRDLPLAGAGLQVLTPGADGAWSLTLPNEAGTWRVQAAARDAAGNLDATPAGLTFVVPRAPVILETALDGRITGSALGDTALVRLSLTAPDGTTQQHDVPVGADGFWRFAIDSRAAGAWAVAARGVSADGYASPTAATASVTLPALPDATISAVTSTGTGANGRLLISGQSVDATSVLLTLVAPDGTTQQFAVPVGPGGAWSTNTAAVTLPGAGLTDAVIAAAVRAAEGGWTITATARNAALVADATPAQASFTLDLTPPDTTLDALPALVFTRDVVVTGTATLGDAVQVRLTAPGAAPILVPVEPDGRWSAVFSSTETRDWVLSARAIDAAGHEDPTAATIAFRTQFDAPDTRILTQEPLRAGGPTSVTLWGDTTFTGSLVAVEVTRPDGTVITSERPVGSASVGHTWTWTVDATQQGVYAVRATAIDAFSNVDATPALMSFLVDRGLPVLTAAASTTRTNGAEVTLSGTASDALSTITSLVVTRSPPMGTGTAFTVPVVEGAWSTTLPLGATEGNWQFRVAARDAAGNQATSAVFVVVDRTPPETVIIENTAAQRIPAITAAGEISVHGAFAGSTGGAVAVRFTLTGPDGSTHVSEALAPNALASRFVQTIALPGEGLWTLTAQARDAAGNLDPTPFVRTINVDRTGPAATLDPVALTNGVVTLGGTTALDATRVEVTLTRADGSQASFNAVAADGAWSLPLNLRGDPGPADTAYQVSLRGVDGLGNAGPVIAAGSFAVDRSAPVLSLTSVTPFSGTAFGFTFGDPTLNASALTLSGGSSGGAVSVGFRATRPDGSVVTASALPGADGAWSLALPLDAEGNWSFGLLTARDALGNASTMALPGSGWGRVLVDQTAPDTALLLPGVPVNATRFIAQLALPSDLSGVTGREVTYLGPAGQIVVSTSSLSGVSFGPGSDGAWTVMARLRDGAGNWDPTPAIGTILVDRTPPGLAITPFAARVVADETLVVRGTTTGGATGIVLDVQGPSSSSRVNLAVEEDGSWSHAIAGAAPGSFHFTAQALDLASNQSDVVRSTVYINRERPETLVTAPAVGVSSAFTLTGSARDPIGPGGVEGDARTPALVRLTLTGPDGQVVTREVGVSFAYEAWIGWRWAATLNDLPQGTWQVAAAAVNRQGLVDLTPATTQITVRSAGPETALAAETLELGTTSVLVTGTATAGHAVDVVLRVETAGFATRSLVVPVAADGSFSVNVTGLRPDALTFISATARDSVGLADATPALLLVRQDSTAPDTRLLTPANNAFLTSEGVTLTGNVNATDVASVAVAVRDASGTLRAELGGAATLAADGTWSFTLPSLAEGRWSFAAAATDRVGNTDATPASITLTLDRTAPDATFTPLAGTVAAPFVVLQGNVSTAEAATVALSATAPDGTLVQASVATAANGAWSWTLPTLQDGSWSVEARATDLAGNIGATASLAVEVLYPQPDVSLFIAPSWWSTSYMSGITASAMVTHLTRVITAPDGTEVLRGRSPWSGSATVSNSIPDGPDGVWTVTLIAEDRFGTRDATPAVALLRVDRTPPETAITSAGWVVADGLARITGTASTDASEVRYALTAPGATPIGLSDPGWSSAAVTDGAWSLAQGNLAEGLWTITARAVDRAWLRDATPAVTSFFVDRTAPDTAIAATPAKISGAGLTLTGTATAGDATQVSLVATRAGAAPLTATLPVTAGGSWSWNFAPPAEGVWTISVAARDAAGNLDASAAQRVITVDTTAPTLTMNAFSTAPLSWSGTAFGGQGPDDLAAILFTITAPDGTVTTGERASGRNWSLNLPNTADGLWTVSIRGRDDVGNIGPAVTGTVLFDTTPPALTQAARWLPESRELEYFGTADTAEVRIRFLAIGSFASPGSLGGSAVVSVTDGSWSIRFSEPGEREWRLAVSATDAAGNRSAPDQLIFVTDTIAPETTITALPEVARPGLITVSGTAAPDAVTVRVEAAGQQAVVPVTAGGWSWSFTAATGSWTVLAAARDAAGNTDATPASASVTVDLFPVITTPGEVTFAENGTGLVLTASGLAQGGAALTWSLGGADAALFTLTGDGRLAFRAAPDFEAPGGAAANNSYALTLTADDGTRAWTQPLTIRVTDVDETPVITSAGTASFAENGTGIAYQAIAADPEGATLLWSLAGRDAARFTIGSDGAVRFATAPDFEAPADVSRNNVYDIVVLASDGGRVAGRAVAITVTGVNDVVPVVVAPANVSAVENSTGSLVRLGVSDADGPAPTLTLGGEDAALFVIGADRVLRFRAPADFERPRDADGDNIYRIEVTAFDGTWTSAPHAIAVTVSNVNERPVITSGVTAAFAENGTGIVHQASATDPDAGTVLSWSLRGADAALFTVDALGAVRFRDAPDFEAPRDADANNSYVLSVVASDGVLEAVRSLTVTVGNLNDTAPVVTSPATASFAENGTAIAYRATARDAEGAPLAWSLGGDDAALFTIDSAGHVRFRAAPDFEAPGDANGDNRYELLLRASDGLLEGARAVSILVTNRDDVAPVLTAPGTASFDENGTGIAWQAAWTDADGGSVAWQLSGADAARFTIDAAGALRFRQAPDFDAPADAGGDNLYDVTVTLLSGPFSVSQAVQVAVKNLVDRPPAMFLPGTVSFTENATGIVLTAAATDPEGGAVTWSLSGTDAARFAIDADGALRFLAAPDFEAPADADGNNLYDVVVVASNGGTTTRQTLAVTVLDADDTPPVLLSPAETRALEGSTGVIWQGRASDALGRPVTWTLGGTDAALFTLDSAGALRFLDAPDFEAPRDAGGDNRHDLVLTASAGGAPASLALTVTVLDVEEVPVISIGAGTTIMENGTTAIPTGTAAVPGGGSVTWSLGGDGAARFRLDPTTGELRFIATPNFEAPGTPGGNFIEITLTASDGRQSTTVPFFVEVSDDYMEGSTPGFASTIISNNVGGRVIGRSAADFIVGGGDNDTLIGLGGNDVLDGGTMIWSGGFSGGPYPGVSGDDLFDPGAGADVVRGGDGFDRVIYRQAGGSGTMTQLSASSWEVLETAGTRDTLEGAEQVFFTDGVWNLGTGAFTAYGFSLTRAASVMEGVPGSSTAYSFTLTRTGFTAEAMELAWRVNAGSATAADFVGGALPWGRVSFAAGQTSATIAVQIAGDTLSESNETFSVTVFREVGGLSMDLLSSSATIANGPTTGPSLAFTSAGSVTFAENGTGVAHQAAAQHSVAGTVLAWSLGGVDAPLFTLDSTGALRFRAAPDFEAPRDADADNRYEVTLTASGGGRFASQAVTILVGDADEAPVFLSASTATVTEGELGVFHHAAARDPEAGVITWSLGGADASLFELDAATGALRFRAEADFEAPADADGDNLFDLVLTATAGPSVTQALRVTLRDNPNEGSGAAETLAGTDSADWLRGFGGNDLLTGGHGRDRLDGGDGQDTLDGGAGADRMQGGAGDDTYLVDDPGDATLELPGGGTDRVLASLSWTLADEVERLILTGTADLSGTGNGLRNTLVGNSGANLLVGGAGDDGLHGGAGNDTLVGGEGRDTLTGGLGADVFVFRELEPGVMDRIADFDAASGDRIDLSDIDADALRVGNDAFVFIGGAAFGGVAGQLRFANQVLAGDVDGDGVADLQVMLVGVGSLAATQIWL